MTSTITTSGFRLNFRPHACWVPRNLLIFPAFCPSCMWNSDKMVPNSGEPPNVVMVDVIKRVFTAILLVKGRGLRTLETLFFSGKKRVGTQIVSHQSISNLNGAIARLAHWDQKISCGFFEIKMKKFRKSMNHGGGLLEKCSKMLKNTVK